MPATSGGGARGTRRRASRGGTDIAIAEPSLPAGQTPDDLIRRWSTRRRRSDKPVPEVNFNAVEPGITATELGGGDPGSHPGRPAEISAEIVARMASIGPDGCTGIVHQDIGELGW